MAYGTVKVDNITFDNGGSDQNVTVSGLYRATTSGVTLSGTIAATTVSGVTVIGSTTVSGATVTGTIANFTSGNFSNIISSAATMSGALIMANQQQIRFREAVGNGVNHIALQAPAIVSADQTITLPDQTGTVITTGDNGSVSSTMLATNLTISAAAGTAAAPSITFTGDTNTGIYSPGADQVAISTNGSGRLFVNSSGSVGIGTSSPGQQLTVATNTGNCYIEAKRASQSAGQVALQLTGGTSGTDWILYQPTSSNDLRIFGNSSDRVTVTSAGSVGIGTTSPGAALDVSGNIRLSAGNPNIEFNNGGAMVYGPAGNTLAFATGGGPSAPQERARIDSSGRVGIGISSPLVPLHVSGSNTTQVGFNGTTKGIRFDFDGTQSTIFGVDNTFFGSYQPLRIGGSYTAFTSGGSEVARIDSSGRVGIGTSSPTAGYLLDCRGNVKFGSPSTAGVYLGVDSNIPFIQGFDSGATYSQLKFLVGATEAARIDSSGRLLVGTSNSTDNARLNSKISVVGTGALAYDIPGIVVNGYTGTTNFHAPFIDLGRSRGTTDGSYTEVVTDDTLGYLTFRGADGAGWSNAALISAEADGDWTTSGDTTDSPGRLSFFTVPNGSSSTVERMRIGNAGDVFFATTSLDPATGCILRSTNVGTYWINGTSEPGTWAQWTFKNGNGTVGSITTNGSATAYNTSSDYRLKENITLLDGAIARLSQLSVHRFNFIADPDTVLDGFIAHEAAAVVPECVTGEKDAEDEDGNPVYQGIDQSKLVPLLTAALQEAIARIETLETAVTALQGA